MLLRLADHRRLSATTTTSTTTIILLILTITTTTIVQAADSFCGQIDIHQQKWLSRDTRTLGARRSPDLRDCYYSCCAVAACDAVTFIGFLADQPQPTANCIIFSCPLSGCVTTDSPSATAGVISVIVRRSTSTLDSTNLTTTIDGGETIEETQDVADLLTGSLDANATSIGNDTARLGAATNETSSSPSPDVDVASNGGVKVRDVDVDESVLDAESTSSSPPAPTSPRPRPTRPTPISATTTIAPPTTTTTEAPFLSSLAPVYMIAVVLVFLVVIVGLNSMFFFLWLCYRRQKTRMRSAPISTIKSPALHAFSPSALQTTASTMA